MPLAPVKIPSIPDSPRPALAYPPPDWPQPGPIDLERHDLPHASSTLEWWYVNSHLELAGGRRVCVFAAFFRQLAGQPTESAPNRYTHSIAWGLSLPEECRHASKVAVDALAAQVGLQNLDAGVRKDDPRLERALREVLSRGHLPGPTRTLTRSVEVAADALNLDYGGDRFGKQAPGQYRLQLNDTPAGHACELSLTLEKPPCRYGGSGVVHGVSGERMFYYFVPRVRVEGRVTIDGVEHRVIGGSAWYDHEFGLLPPDLVAHAGKPERARPEPAAAPNLPLPDIGSPNHSPANDSVPPGAPEAGIEDRGETRWRWLSIQLDDQRELSVFFVTRRETGQILDRWTMLVLPDGETRAFDDTELETLETWRSTRTFVEYPIAFKVKVPRARISVTARASFPDQEVVTVISDPAFWEGTVEVEGTVAGQPVRGRGWLECKGFAHPDLDSFYGAVGREVRSRLREIVPLPSEAGCSLSHMMMRGTGDERPDTFGVEAERLKRSLAAPIRAITDRGGKGWRSYAALACIDLVGGDSRKFLHWLVLPEIVHVGSLIVDDVEDESTVRRGGAACHLLYGTAAAINAGTAAYFLAEPPVDQDNLAAETKLKIYRLYFDAMRAGHAGQALDLCDVTDLAEAAALSGEVTALERHVRSVHRLKTAVPAANFARVGALLGGGSQHQVDCVGRFFEAIGLAFQIIDDVLNVSGFDRDLKQRGEDIRTGKVTLPIVKALALLDADRRTWLWQTLQQRPSEDEVVARVCQVLHECGALSDCRQLAQQVVEEAWAGLDGAVEDSQFKLMFRAFSWYVLERHY